MTGIDFSLSLQATNIMADIIKTFLICICTYYASIRIMNLQKSKIHCISVIIGTILISIVCVLIENKFGLFNRTICLITLLTCIIYISTKRNVGALLLIVLISLSINYIIFFVAVVISFIPSGILNIKNDFLNLIIITIIHMIILFKFLKLKKFKYGISFLNENMQNEYIELLILNISVTVLFSTIIIVNANMDLTKGLFIAIIVFAIIMFITIQKSLQLYYKQKLLIQDLNETKEELEKKKQEIEQLEKENLNFSKKSHSLAHKQRALEYQINQLLLKSEIAEETNIETELNSKTEKAHTNLEELTKVKDEINKLSKEVYNKTATAELSKTGIFEIDNILEYMQSESNKNDIDFNLQITRNIYHMINNIIDKEDLQILLADHIKNAIIAIKHANNINKSILVKLGKIENVYSLYIYDSGIEFEKETLMNLGKKPSTTHAKEGGTGMGFMNTFDTLKKYNASLIINEIGIPSKDNYTKVLIIKFDHKCEFKLTSYRQKEIGEISEKLIDKSTISDIIVENKSQN